jgi:hypothetical protein
MGLLSTTYVTNTTVNEVVSPKALTDNTKALEKLSDSTRNLAKSIDRGRIKLTHKRYCELRNKSMLLDSIFEFMNDYVSIAYKIRSGELYETFKKALECYRGTMCSYSGPIQMNDRTRFVWNDKEKICNLEINEKLFTVKEPNYIPETEGEANINEDEYNLLLKKEILLEDYSKAVEELPTLLYKLLENTLYNIDSESRDSVCHWIDYCNEGTRALARDYNMDYVFGPIKTENFKWRMTTKIGSSSFALKLLK